MSARTSISGLLDPASYAALAQLHRPTDPDVLAVEVHRLHSSGLTARDIGSALRLDHAAVVTILAGQLDPAAGTHKSQTPE